MKHRNPVRVSTVALVVAGLLQSPAYAQSLKDAVDLVVKNSPDVLIETNQRLARIFHKTGRISLNPSIKLGLRQ